MSGLYKEFVTAREAILSHLPGQVNIAANTLTGLLRKANIDNSTKFNPEALRRQGIDPFYFVKHRPSITQRSH